MHWEHRPACYEAQLSRTERLSMRSEDALQTCSRGKITRAMTDIYESIRRLFVPIHTEGYPFIAVAAIAALLLGLYVWEPLGWILAVVALWTCYFFRDPE